MKSFSSDGFLIKNLSHFHLTKSSMKAYQVHTRQMKLIRYTERDSRESQNNSAQFYSYHANVKMCVFAKFPQNFNQGFVTFQRQGTNISFLSSDNKAVQSKDFDNPAQRGRSKICVLAETLTTCEGSRESKSYRGRRSKKKR